MRWSFGLKLVVSTIVFFGLLLSVESIYRHYYANHLRATACIEHGGKLLSQGELVICGYGAMPKPAPASP